MFMAPATGRPSSSVAHGSAHTPPGAAATHCTMSELAAPAEQCSAGTVNRLQTLPVASDGATNGRSSGWTSRRSACSLTAAGTTSSATAFPCADDRAPFLQTNAPSNAFAVQHQEKPQCLLLSHGSVVGALMRTGTHRSLQTTLHICNASCAPRGTSPTTPGDAHTPPARTASSRKQGYVRMRAGHPPAIHIAGIITSSSSSTAGRGVTWINRRMAYVEEKT
ncbi:regulator of sigma E protease [Trypanosoma cruzi]|nr:regulator of sigma E protease [Trypanosoma cruzi]